MAEAAARREARRKRILENSEIRLRVISGLTKIDDSGDLPLQDDDGPVFSLPTLETQESTERLSQPQSALYCSQDNAPANRPEELEKFDCPNEIESHSIESSLSDKSKHSGSGPQQSEVQQSLVATLFAVRLHLIFLALLVRLLLSSKYGYLFGESLFAPLITLQLVKYWGIGTKSDNIKPNGGLLNAALILSGMSGFSDFILVAILMKVV